MLTVRCRRLKLAIYGRVQRASGTDQVAREHAAPERPLRIVAIKALRGGRGQEVFYSTCYDASTCKSPLGTPCTGVSR
jgi:hypothetical protein